MTSMYGITGCCEEDRFDVGHHLEEAVAVA